MAIGNMGIARPSGLLQFPCFSLCCLNLSFIFAKRVKWFSVNLVDEKRVGSSLDKVGTVSYSM